MDSNPLQEKLPIMLNNLYRLYKNVSEKTPLEDFTTTALVGVLAFDDALLDDFCISFLNLERGKFSIKSQILYKLHGDRNCIVDIVIESNIQLCFIENKVNSKEGPRQLERYSKVLNILKQKSGKETYLFYCTKEYDKKTITDHKFKQFRWYEIASFFNNHPSENALKKDFLNFLKLRKMSHDLTFTTANISAIEQLQDTIELLYAHLERAKPSFINSFINGSKSMNDGFSISQVLKHNRLIHYVKDVIGNSNGWSEIKYGIKLSSLKVYCGIWIDKSNNEYENFKSYVLSNCETFEIREFPRGIEIELSSSIKQYLDDKDGDGKILNWYKYAFGEFKSIIDNTKHLSWKVKTS